MSIDERLRQMPEEIDREIAVPAGLKQRLGGLSRPPQRRRLPWGSWLTGAVAAAAVVVAAALTLLPGARVNAQTVAGKAEQAVSDPAAAAIAGYFGTITSPTRGETQVSYLAPDKLLTREKATGRVHGLNGKTEWEYDPETHSGTLKTDAPPTAISQLLPGFAPFQQFLAAMTSHHELSIVSSREKVAGRRVYVLKLSDREGVQPDLLAWVDQESYLVLQTQSVAKDGTVLSTSGFTAFTLGKPDPGLFQPNFPPGTNVTTHQQDQTLAALIQRSDLPVREPQDLPADWRLAEPGLVEFQGHKRLSWFYQVAGKTTLSVTVTDQLPERVEQGTPVVRLPMKATAYTNEITGWSGLYWVFGETFYRIEGPNLTTDQLLAIAGALMPS